ncbi:MAG: hypothetical protein A2539_01015 [Elusimicrobia bacterium RIFOXYD2_FULL_34_15]|nr:MAG: hypothetical protein A2539_01015 [Elusimicrobia bacterium RIFOXYD2_FULL_34_15]
MPATFATKTLADKDSLARFTTGSDWLNLQRDWEWKITLFNSQPRLATTFRQAYLRRTVLQLQQ